MLSISKIKVQRGAFNLYIDALKFEHGTINVLIGPNGSGKTTLLKALGGILDYDGNVFINDEKIDDKTQKERAKLFGYLPQSINLSPAYVKDFLMLGRFAYTNIFSGYSSSDREIVKHTADEFELTPYLTRDITTLSQGELQRVILAKVFIQKPKVLLLDEPTTALDLGFKEHIKNAIYKYLELNKDCTAVISTHDPEIFAGRTNKTIMLKSGDIFNGDINTLFGLKPGAVRNLV